MCKFLGLVDDKMAILPVQCGTKLQISASEKYGLLSEAVHFRPVLTI
jgi:hypothetical protein